MSSCVICKKDVTTGFVVCGDCAHKLEPFTLPPDLAYFIDQLAEDLVQNMNSLACDMCAMAGCSSLTGGLTCRNGIKAWLLDKAGQYLSHDRAASEVFPAANSYAEALEARQARENGSVGCDADSVISKMEHIIREVGINAKALPQD